MTIDETALQSAGLTRIENVLYFLTGLRDSIFSDQVMDCKSVLETAYWTYKGGWVGNAVAAPCTVTAIVTGTSDCFLVPERSFVRIKTGAEGDSRVSGVTAR